MDAPPVLPVSARTRTFAVLGHPVSHSRSPVMHNAALRALGVDGVYLAYDVAPEQLGPVLDAMYRMGFAGANLTIPLKEEAFALLSQKDDSALLVGAVNTIQRGENGWIGHNTDGYGVEAALGESFGEQFAGRDVLVAGCGGAGRATALYAARQGATRLFLWNRTPTRAHAVAQEIADKGFSTPVLVLDSLEREALVAREASVVIQCSSLGMKSGEPSPIPESVFRSGQCLLDMIYTSEETPTMSAARRSGASAVNGLSLLLHQGARAFQIWTSLEPPVDVMRTALARSFASPT